MLTTQLDSLPLENASSADLAYMAALQDAMSCCKIAVSREVR